MDTNCTIQKRRGFVALAIVMMVAIIVMAAGVVLPDLSTRINNRTEDETQDRMASLFRSVEAYARDYLAVPPNLEVLKNQDGSPRWQGPYLENSIQGWAGTSADPIADAWGRKFQWEASARSTGTITSWGVDGVSGTEDDLTLTVTIEPLLIEVTLARLQSINTAIGHYPTEGVIPLQAPATNVVAQLQTQGLLSVGPSWHLDAFGDAFLTIGTPVRSFRSIHISEGGG